MENQFIQWLNRQVEAKSLSPDLQLGIGDDAAVVQTAGKSLVCSDMIAEGTHFLANQLSDYEVAGRKALAVNLSDIAAMGGTPKFATMSLLVPRESGLEIAKAIATGLLQLANQYGVELIGGDTCSWDGAAVIDVTVIGEQSKTQQLLTRNGTRPGDLIFCTGSLGGSILGKHLTFSPRIDLIQTILENFKINSATDVTDGFVIDLQSLLSHDEKLGAVVYGHSLPLSEAAKKMEQSPAENGPTTLPADAPQGTCRALYDGEDFEILFTMTPEEAQRFVVQLQGDQLKLQAKVTLVGKVTQDPGIVYQFEGSSYQLPLTGFLH